MAVPVSGEVMQRLFREFVPHYEGGPVVLVRTPGRLSVTHGTHTEIYDTRASSRLTYSFNVVLLLALDNREYDALVRTALASPQPVEHVNAVVLQMPTQDSITIVLRAGQIEYAPARVFY
jgi:hypothetical protein